MTVNTETGATDTTDVTAAAEAVATPPVDQAPPPAAEPPNADPTPTEDQPTDGPSLELPFKLEEIDDDFTLTGEQARQWIQARQAQMQAGLTQATQSIAAERAQIAEYLDVIDRLNSEETRREALGEILEGFGYALPDEEPAEPGDELDESTMTPTERALKARLDARDAAEQAAAEEQRNRAAQDEQRAAFQADVVQNMDAFAKEHGFEDHTAVPDEVKQDIVTRAVALPRLANGMLDFATAIANHLTYAESIREAERAAYLKSKEAPDPGIVDGPSGDSVTDLSSREKRLERANAVAGAHY